MTWNIRSAKSYFQMTSSLSFPFHNGKRRGSVFLVLKVLAKIVKELNENEMSLTIKRLAVKELNENEMSLTIKRLVMGVKF